MTAVTTIITAIKISFLHRSGETLRSWREVSLFFIVVVVTIPAIEISVIIPRGTGSGNPNDEHECI